LFYVQAWEDYATIRLTRDPIRERGTGVVGETGERGQYYMGGTARPYTTVPGAPAAPQIGRGPINTWTSEAGYGRVLAIDPQTGEKKWAFDMTDFSAAGITTTATDLVFTGTRDGYFLVLDARTGELLWKANLGSQVFAAPMTYQANGRQYVAVISGLTLVTFALPEAASRP
jgi:alcohol dehydrogenase (cytochrome c)